ncbi:hypothetical protein RhiirC2_796215 [Rhizophagus irregularis]|uniref:Uncharacterized protein n=1 Tax=Rhizophagus irregularis TaxID=588596 RepID=A0A2N1MA45_9GLOM|nr:hypothetical protein RhiirC2_796215 [Rhizophagus irregularis]
MKYNLIIKIIVTTATISEFNKNSYRNSIIRNTGLQDIVISGDNFDTEIYNKDYRYKQLMAGFMISDINETQLPISFSDSSLEALIN